MRFLLPIAALVLVGCQPVAPKPRPSGDPAVTDLCGAEGLAHLVGQDERAFAAMTFPASTRFIRPGDAVTMDFSAARLNFDIGADGRITRVWCG